MPKQPKEKSTHLQELEAVFDRRTRRFSPFAVLGLNSSEKEGVDTQTESAASEGYNPPTHPQGSGWVAQTHSPDPPTHRGVGGSESAESPDFSEERPVTPTGEWVGGTPEWVGGTHTRVVVVKNTSTGFVPTHPHVGGTHPPTKLLEQKKPQPATQIQDVLAVTQLKTRLGKKARQVLSYLNSLRSIERTEYTVTVGYTQICTAVGVHPHYLRRNVLPKLAMLGLIGTVYKSLQGTVYRLHYDAAFFHLIAREDEEPSSPSPLETPEVMLQPVAASSTSTEALPSWVDREHWEWLTPEIVHQLIAKAGSESQAQEKLAVILYNETHGPVERRIRDRRSVLAHYLRTTQADIWPNDDGFETLALRRARQERDQAVQEKALAEETLRARQEAAQARFLAALADPQLQWLKQEAKRRVDTQSSARFLTSRYPLYKAEEEQLIHEWMDRVDYGERVPHAVSDGSSNTEEIKTLH
jgi:hypothetical protein